MTDRFDLTAGMDHANSDVRLRLGEARQVSFRPDDSTPLPENAVVHIILGMWMDGWGMELSETIHVRERDAVCLTQFPRDVHVIDV